MAPHEPMDARRVRVLRGVRMNVVVAMVRRPPQRAALNAGSANHCEDELNGAGGTKRAVRKVAMVEAGQGEHADGVEHTGHEDRYRGDAHPEGPNAGQMHGEERDGAQPIDALVIKRPWRSLPVEPRPQGGQAAPRTWGR